MALLAPDASAPVTWKVQNEARALERLRRGSWSYTRAALSQDSPGLLDDGADAFEGDRLAGAPRSQGSLFASYGTLGDDVALELLYGYGLQLHRRHAHPYRGPNRRRAPPGVRPPYGDSVGVEGRVDADRLRRQPVRRVRRHQRASDARAHRPHRGRLHVAAVLRPTCLRRGGLVSGSATPSAGSWRVPDATRRARRGRRTHEQPPAPRSTPRRESATARFMYPSRMLLSDLRLPLRPGRVRRERSCHERLRSKWNEPASSTSPEADAAIISGPSPAAMCALRASSRW